MFIINCYDVNNLITSFISNLSDLLNWSSVCTSNYNNTYEVLFMIILKNPILYKRYILRFVQADPKCPSVCIRRLKHANTLICNNRITNYTLSKLTNLVSLHLHNNTLITDNSLGLLTNLTKLNIHENYKITDISISNLKKLTYLHCGTFNVNLTDNSIKHLTKLTVLYTSNINICDSTIMQLTSLTELYCNYNPRLTNDCFNYITNLTHLSVGKNLFNIEGISRLHNLTYLNINSETYISDNNYFKYMPKLTYLDCSYNNMITDEALIYLHNLKYLKKCNQLLSDNSLRYLNNLIFLDCGYNNNFTNYSFSKLTNLNVLLCGYNKHIRNKTLSFFPNLKHLHCCRNKYISDIGVNSLMNLLVLDVGNNTSITHNSIIKLNKLIFLDYRRNINIDITLLNNIPEIRKTDRLYKL